MSWSTFSTRLGNRVKSLFGQYSITEAYRCVFLGNPSRAEQHMVLAHLAARCGFNTIAPTSIKSEELWFREGKRAAFAEIFGHLALSHEDMVAFENAVKREVAFNPPDNI